jgi:hypothetical protein
MRSLVPLFLLVVIPPDCRSAERVDNVLAKLVPPDSTALFGARIEQLKTTMLYTKLVADQKLPQLDSFSGETGFDPRRDVRDLLVASNGKPNAGVLLARGNFHVTVPNEMKSNLKLLRYKGYNITVSAKDDSGFCIMDSTLAIAGPTSSMKAALDQYLSGDRDAGTPLLGLARAVPMQYQVWSVSTGGADFMANNLPRDGNAANFGKIFRALQDTHFQADLSKGLNAMAQGNCASEADAKSLGDAARGLIGFGRLSVPDNQPELLRIWDGVRIEQNQRTITISANIPQDLVEKLVQVFESNPKPPGPPKPPLPPKPPRVAQAKN